jgi:hydrophobe/amphiphile efflux-1 (HAE1) family protein
VAQYPDLVPPAVTVTAVYPGASPEVVSELVAAPLERALNGVADVQYMQSTSTSSGVMTLTVTFSLGIDAEVANNRVNNKIQGALSGLPEDVRRMGVTISAGAGSFLQIITLSSPDERYDSLFLNNYATANVIDTLQRVPGVAVASSLVAEEYAMRIWLDPARLAAAGLTPQDIAAAVREQNAQYAAGSLGLEPAPSEARMVWLSSTAGRRSTAGDFGDIILRVGGNKEITRLRDVAELSLGAADYSVRSRLNGKSVAGISIVLSPGSNALETAELVKEAMRTLSADFPEGMEYSIPYDITRFVDLSIQEVKSTLIEAMVLVALVIFVFLHSLRATIVPCVAVPVAIVGTFAGMWLLGFSINTLTLFGLVLAIGIVVDDAIVVLENAERIMRSEKLTPRAASSRAMEEVTAPVIVIVLVLAAVFEPVSCMGGMTGEMFRQFGITIALSVFISGIVALTLTPVLCARLLKDGEHKTPNAFVRLFENGFERVTGAYVAGVRFLVRRPAMAILGLLAVCGLTALLLVYVPEGLTPDEDQGYIIAAAMLPDGAAMTRTDATLNALSEALLKNPDVDAVLTIAGQDILGGGGNIGNAGAAFIMLKPWEERKKAGQSSFAIAQSVFALGREIPDGLTAAFNPPSIVGMGTVGGLEGYLQNNSGASLAEISQIGGQLGLAAAERKELLGVSCGISMNTPTVRIELDVDKTKLLRVPVSDAYQTLSTFLSGSYINDFVLNGRVFKVTMQSDARFRTVPDDINDYYVRNMENEMIPLAELINVSIGSGVSSVVRFNGQPAARLSGQAAPGHSNVEAMRALEEIAQEILPPGYALAWSGSSHQEKSSGGTNYLVLALGLGLVFMILLAQFEHPLPPLVSVLAVPFAVFGALSAIFLAGFDNGIYVQVALVTLIGLSVKNSILIVEFAWVEFLRGASPAEAALSAAAKRFRPIVMTSLAFILGCVPLVLSSGAGAASRHVLGGSIIGGMLAATAVAPMFTPAFFAMLLRGRR